MRSKHVVYALSHNCHITAQESGEIYNGNGQLLYHPSWGANPNQKEKLVALVKDLRAFADIIEEDLIK